MVFFKDKTEIPLSHEGVNPFQNLNGFLAYQPAIMG